jgi:hypothetical protein
MTASNDLEQILQRIQGFSDLQHVEKIKTFGWYLHRVEENARFSGVDVLGCYDRAGLKRPANISKQLDDLCRKSPPELLKDRNGYSLERRTRDTLDQSLGNREITIQVNALIANLADKLTSETERDFFNEALICYRHAAFRAAVVMVWNLTYSHFCEWILRRHAAAFNGQWPIRYPDLHKKCKVKTIATLDHFGELKESEVIDIARSAGLISAGIYRSLVEKLGKRNNAAHPSTHKFTQIQAEEFVHDLITNVSEKLA